MFIHDFSDYVRAIDTDLRAIAAMGAALAGSDKPFVNTFWTLVLAFGPSGVLGTETDVVDAAGPRVASELATIAPAERGVRSSIVGLAPTVHGSTDHHGQ